VVTCRTIGIVATLGGNILAARLLGPAEFGRYLFLSSVAVCGGLLGAAGLSDASLRFSSESLALGRRALAVAYVLRAARLCVVSTLLAAGVTAVGLIAFHLATGRLTQPALLVTLTVFTLAALAWQQLASETLRGWNNLKFASLFSGGTAGGPISTLLFLGGVIGLSLAHVSLSSTGAVGLMALSVCVTVPFALLSVWRMIRPRAAAAPEVPAALSTVEDRQLVSMAGTVLALNLLAFAGEQFDIWIGEALLPPDQLGVYGVAKRSMLLVAMPVQMAMLMILASIPRLHAQGRRRELEELMRGSAGLAAVPSLAGLALLVVFPETILQFLFGGSYGGAAAMIRILAIGQLALVLVGNPSSMLALAGGHRTLLSVNLIAAVVIVVGGPLAAAAFGAWGLASVMAGALVAQYGLQWWLAWRRLGVWTHVGLPRLARRDDSPAPEAAAKSRSAPRQRDRADAADGAIVSAFSSQPEAL
jgi:O-antigen/teichoic acid export membrane protein